MAHGMAGLAHRCLALTWRGTPGLPNPDGTQNHGPGLPVKTHPEAQNET